MKNNIMSLRGGVSRRSNLIIISLLLAIGLILGFGLGNAFGEEDIFQWDENHFSAFAEFESHFGDVGDPSGVVNFEEMNNLCMTDVDFCQELGTRYGLYSESDKKHLEEITSVLEEHSDEIAGCQTTDCLIDVAQVVSEDLSSDKSIDKSVVASLDLDVKSVEGFEQLASAVNEVVSTQGSNFTPEELKSFVVSKLEQSGASDVALQAMEDHFKGVGEKYGQYFQQFAGGADFYDPSFRQGQFSGNTFQVPVRGADGNWIMPEGSTFAPGAVGQFENDQEFSDQQVFFPEYDRSGGEYSFDGGEFGGMSQEEATRMFNEGLQDAVSAGKLTNSDVSALQGAHDVLNRVASGELKFEDAAAQQAMKVMEGYSGVFGGQFGDHEGGYNGEMPIPGDGYNFEMMNQSPLDMFNQSLESGQMSGFSQTEIDAMRSQAEQNQAQWQSGAWDTGHTGEWNNMDTSAWSNTNWDSMMQNSGYNFSGGSGDYSSYQQMSPEQMNTMYQEWQSSGGGSYPSGGEYHPPASLLETVLGWLGYYRY